MQPVIQYDPTRQPLARPMYAASTNGIVTLATTANNTTSVAYLFHPAANTKRAEITKIIVSVNGNGGKNQLSVRGAFISAENATPGGTSQTINPLDRDDAASTLIFRTGATGAPVRVAGDLISLVTDDGVEMEFDVVNSNLLGKPIVLRSGVGEGFEIRAVTGGTAIAAGTSVGITYYWTEI